jgi:hypothetical protein
VSWQSEPLGHTLLTLGNPVFDLTDYDFVFLIGLLCIEPPQWEPIRKQR